MYPFVSSATLTSIFGRDLFYRDETIPILRQLAGFEVKPFECVATTKEIIVALSLAVAKGRRQREPLPPVLQYAVDHVPGSMDSTAASTILSGYGDHRIPPEFESILKGAGIQKPNV